MTQTKPTPQHFAAMGFPSPEALAEREAADKAASIVLKDIVTGINAAMHQKPSDRTTSLRTIAKRLREINQIGRAESLEFAASRIDADPLDFDALRMVKITIEELATSASMLGSASTSTVDTPGAVIPPEPTAKRPNEDYERSVDAHLARQEESRRFLHPIDAL
ncbi:hypothetical protein [Paraburkholderia strydomiana]